MTPAPIRNAAARAFWEACALKGCKADECDQALDVWADRFGDQELLDDIAANKAGRGRA